MSLTEARRLGLGHVLAHHAELAPHWGALGATLTRPERVTRDRRHDRREVFYRAHFLPAPLDHLHLKVVVDFGLAGAEAAGVVITACPVPDVTEGEVQLWRSSSAPASHRPSPLARSRRRRSAPGRLHV